MHQLFWYGVALFIFFGLFVESILIYVFFSFSSNCVMINVNNSGIKAENPVPIWLYFLLIFNGIIIIISIILMIIGAVKSVSEFGLELIKAVREETYKISREESLKTFLMNQEFGKSPKKLKK